MRENNKAGGAKCSFEEPKTWPSGPERLEKEHSRQDPPFVYSDIVKEHFLNPKNFLMGDESAYPHDAEGLVGNPICGDQMLMMLQIDQKTDTITDIKWKTYGCASAIASTSALSELAKGKTLDEALAITPEAIESYLGGLPKHKFHCSVLGQDALKNAIDNYHQNQKSKSTAKTPPKTQ